MHFEYKSFIDAQLTLISKFDNQPAPEEFCMWIFEGEKNGGLQAYVKNEDNGNVEKFPSVGWLPDTKLKDCVDDLQQMFFLKSDIEKFIPVNRYMTGKKLLVRWALSIGDEKTNELIKRYLRSLEDLQSDSPTSPILQGFNPGIAAIDKPAGLQYDALYRLDAITEIEEKEQIPLNNRYGAGFDLYFKCKEHPQNWLDWLNKLGLSVDDAKNKLNTHIADDAPVAEILLADAELRALSEETKRHYSDIDSILDSAINQPTSYDDRVRFCAWRFILKAGLFHNPENEYQEKRNQKFRKKISEINRILGVEPQQTEAVEDVNMDSQVDATASERELTRWFRETWIKEGSPGGTLFFNALKKYVNQPGSPIVQHYTASKTGAGIRWNTGSATDDMTKKAIQNKVSIFKKEPQ